MTPRLQTKYQAEIRDQFKSEFGYTNPHQIPKVTKVVLNIGFGVVV
jgi:large subunit ribosomal protein L5